jgi:uncharacterized protein (DUF433 family)
MVLPDFLTEHPYGEIRLTDHRIGLYGVISRYQEGYSAEMLAEEFPTLSLSLVHRTIAFYLDNRAEVDAYVSAYAAELERLEREHVPSPALLEIRERLAARQALQSAKSPGA